MNSRRPQAPPNLMASAALTMGIAAFLFILNAEMALLFGSLGILFACLSRGDSLKMPGKAMGGCAASIFAIVVSILLTILSYYILTEMFGWETVRDPEALQNAVNELYLKLLEQPPTGGSTL